MAPTLLLETHLAHTRQKTIRFAMLEMITSPPYLFEEVVRLHFSLKAQEIKQQCAKWAQMHDEVFEMQRRSGRHNIVAEIGPVVAFTQVSGPLLELLTNPSASASTTTTTARLPAPAVVLTLQDEVDEDEYVDFASAFKEDGMDHDDDDDDDGQPLLDLSANVFDVLPAHSAGAALAAGVAPGLLAAKSQVIDLT
jgi:hypothetical protein